MLPMSNYLSSLLNTVVASRRNDIGSALHLENALQNWKGAEKVLILDGDTRSALAATRSLGRRGVPVVVAGETARTLAGASKYCSESFTYPSPTEGLRSFLSTVRAECSRRGIRVIFPMTDISMAAVLKHQEEFKDFQLPFAGFPAFDALTDKWNLMRLAQRLNITVPQTHYIGDALALQRVCPTLKFPVVLKPYRSMIWTNVTTASWSRLLLTGAYGRIRPRVASAFSAKVSRKTPKLGGWQKLFWIMWPGTGWLWSSSKFPRTERPT